MLALTDPSTLDKEGLEQGTTFAPKFDEHGLITAVIMAINSDTHEMGLAMVAHMNAEALHLTLTTGQVHFYSRSRKKLWRKGEESGQTLTVQKITTDCDQDALAIHVTVGANGGVCHVGFRTCFYRTVVVDNGGESVRLLTNSQKLL